MHSTTDNRKLTPRISAGLLLMLLIVAGGCRTTATQYLGLTRSPQGGSSRLSRQQPTQAAERTQNKTATESDSESGATLIADEPVSSDDPLILPVSGQQTDAVAADDDLQDTDDQLTGTDDAFEQPDPVRLTPVVFDDVVWSVLRHYPLVRAAYLERTVANGNQLAAWGELDTKLKASSENTPLGFYETYRTGAGVEQPLYDGGYAFAGYRNGRGNFEPWYRERNTNNGGEFKGGFRVPLLRDHDIDERRAGIWRATWDQQLANPVIRSRLIQFTAEAGRAYWKWVAAGQKYQLGVRWLELAESRNDQIRRRVEAQDLDPPELIDNERAIAKREAKLADSLRTLEQAAQTLSVYLRDSSGQPRVPSPQQLPVFPGLLEIDAVDVDADVLRAQQNRPELEALSLQLQRLRVDHAEACNLTRPRLDAQLAGSQDVGEPTSSKRDKSEFVLEGGLYFEMPVQQRKGRGKMHAISAKMAQVNAKRQIMADKVAAEVRAAHAGLERSREASIKAEQAAELADQMADIERRKFELGESDLLKVALREQYALEAAEEQVEAELTHFSAFSDYAASLGIDRPEMSLFDSED